MAIVPKCGSHTIRSCFRSKEISVEKALKREVRVAWVRNPLDRLESYFSYKNANSSLGPIQTWEDFIDSIFITNNAHWIPQIELLTHNSLYVPTITHKFEDFPKLWGSYFTGLIPHLNGCVHESVNREYRLSDIEAYYKEDFEIWHRHTLPEVPPAVMEMIH